MCTRNICKPTSRFHSCARFWVSSLVTSQFRIMFTLFRIILSNLSQSLDRLKFSSRIRFISSFFTFFVLELFYFGGHIRVDLGVGMYVVRLCFMYVCFSTSLSSPCNLHRHEFSYVHGNLQTCLWCACVSRLIFEILCGLRSIVPFTSVANLHRSYRLLRRRRTPLSCTSLLMWLSHRRCYKCGVVR